MGPEPSETEGILEFRMENSGEIRPQSKLNKQVCRLVVKPDLYCAIITTSFLQITFNNLH